jgi:hypothetical protein
LSRQWRARGCRRRETAPSRNVTDTPNRRRRQKASVRGKKFNWGVSLGSLVDRGRRGQHKQGEFSGELSLIRTKAGDFLCGLAILKELERNFD